MPFKESFLWDLIKSIGLPVLLFMSGYLLNVVIENRKESIRLKNVEKYFKTLVELECQVAIEQAFYYENCAKRLYNVDERNIAVEKVSGHPEKSLNDIDHNDLYKIFIRGNNNIHESTRKFNNLLTKLDYIDNSMKLVTIHSEEFQATENQLNKKWYETGKTLSRTLSKIANTRDVTKAIQSEDLYIRKIGQVLDFTFTTPKKDQTLTATYENVTLSLLRFINQDANIDDPRNKEFIDLLVKSKLIYGQYQDLYERRRNSCLNSAKDLKQSAEEIKNIVSSL